VVRMCGRSAALRSLEATQPGRHAVSSPGLRPGGSENVCSANGRMEVNGLDAESGPSRHGHKPNLRQLPWRCGCLALQRGVNDMEH
jgi:hypothetical protein